MPWSGAQVDSQIFPVHAALTPAGAQGEVVLFGGDEHWAAQAETAGNNSWKKTRIYDVATHAIVGGQTQSPDSDVFCCHHAFIGDGRLLIAGGTSEWSGSPDAHAHELDFLGHSRCWLYNARERRWIETTRLNRNPNQPNEPRSGGRWYPGMVTLGDGSVLAIFGHLDKMDTRHRNTLPERFAPGAQAWINLPDVMAKPGEPAHGDHRFLMYARMFVLPGGKVFIATPMPAGFSVSPGSSDGPHRSTCFDAGTAKFVAPQAVSFDGVEATWDYPAVLLPLLPPNYHAHVLFWQGRQPKHISLNDPNPDWVNTSNRAGGLANRNRVNSNAVLLPTGDVCIVGGVHDNGVVANGVVTQFEDPVLRAEILRPGIDWTTGTYTSNGDGTWSAPSGDAAHARNYHSVALLLPNGKVWVAGGNTNAQSGDPDGDLTVGGVTKKRGIKRIELYEPGYIAVPNRIRITSSPRLVTYLEEFDIGLDRPATDVGRVALVRNGSATHSTNNDQRYVGLEIVSRGGNTVRVRCPRNGTYAPPGYYMLWVTDTTGNPCQLAPFVRVSYLTCRVIADRSTFSKEEVQAVGGGSNATFPKALYVDFDGYVGGEFTGSPNFELEWADGSPVSASDLRLIPAGRFDEISPASPDVAARTTFAFDVVFPSMGAFANLATRRSINARFWRGVVTDTTVLELKETPNPYMIDIDPAVMNEYWLSTDIRVLKVHSGETRLGVAQGLGGGAPYNFIRGVLDRLRNGSESFASLPTQGPPATLDAAYMSGNPPRPTFNYAVARVRYRASTTSALGVRCFFRMCNVAATGLEYDPAGTYNRTVGPNPKPLLGLIGGQIVSFPFFSRPRQNTVSGQPGAGGQDLQEIDPAYDVQTIAPASSGAEVTAYFGCYLDITEPTKRFPLNPSGNGPYPEADARPIRDLIRSWHNCLIAEIFLDVDPTRLSSTPQNSDNLSQRNLAIVGLENPGVVSATRTVMHTFEVVPSSIAKDEPTFSPFHDATLGLMAVGERLAYPDELFFDWGSVPPETVVTLYFSDIDTADMIDLAKNRIGTASFTVVDKTTVRFRVGDCAWLPLPGSRTIRIPVLLAAAFPDTIKEGEVYRLTIRQVNGRRNRFMGGVTLELPVTKAPFLRWEAERELSFMRHIATTIPFGDRWKSIFDRYIGHLTARVDGLGGNSRDIAANPDGTGLPYRPIEWSPGDDYPPQGFGSGGAGTGQGPGTVPPLCPPMAEGDSKCWEGWAFAAAVGATLVVAAFLPTFGAAVLLAVLLVLMAFLLHRWSRCCQGRFICAVLDKLGLGSAAAVVVLAIMAATTGLFGWKVPLVMAGLLLLGSMLVSYPLRCRNDTC